MDVNHSKPAKPELSFGGNGLEVTFMPPDGAAHAVVYVYDADGKKSFLDAGTNNKILAPGETGRVLPVRGQHLGTSGKHARVDFGPALGGIQTVLQKYLEPV